MSISEETTARIDSVVGSDRVVLFMKGSRAQPMCGFSAATVDILDSLVGDYSTVDVLEDPEVREGIKAYSSWPTIPQLYIAGEFVGGCDIVKQLYNTGELHRTLGLDPPDRTPPAIELSATAGRMIAAALAENAGMAVHLAIDARWRHGLHLGPAEGHEVESQCADLRLLMDVGTAARANGLVIDIDEGLAGQEIVFRNPNQPGA